VLSEAELNMTERMDWDNMRVFRVVAELGSMNAAAHRLQESAPTISRKIDQLEEDLKTQLLVRTTRGVELTDAGRIALSHIHAMAESVSEVFENAGNRDRDVEGRIVLATGDGLGPYWIAPRLPEFQAANPKVQLRIQVVDKAPVHRTEIAGDHRPEAGRASLYELRFGGLFRRPAGTGAQQSFRILSPQDDPA
jgi:DNA-binding transcriptional LysR family regulator